MKYDLELLVVRTKHYETSPGDAETKEHLRGRLLPDQGVQDLVPGGDEQVPDTIHCSGQRDSSHQKRYQHHVGEGGGEVDYFATGFDTLDSEVSLVISHKVMMKNNEEW